MACERFLNIQMSEQRGIRLSVGRGPVEGYNRHNDAAADITDESFTILSDSL